MVLLVVVLVVVDCGSGSWAAQQGKEEGGRSKGLDGGWRLVVGCTQSQTFSLAC